MSGILVVANQTLGGNDLLEFVRARMAKGPCEFTLVVPATARSDRDPAAALVAGLRVPGRALNAASDTDDYADAQRRLELGLDALRRLGATVDGVVGDPDPLQAVQDILSRRRFDEVVVSTLPIGASRWLRQDLPHKVERRFHLPVTVVTAGSGVQSDRPRDDGVVRYVRVKGRDDVATVIEVGRNIGGSINVSCHVLLFPETGEVCFYDSAMVHPVDEAGSGGLEP